MSLCPDHDRVHHQLQARLGRAHHGRRIARRTLESISRQCPSCAPDEAPEPCETCGYSRPATHTVTLTDSGERLRTCWPCARETIHRYPATATRESKHGISARSS